MKDIPDLLIEDMGNIILRINDTATISDGGDVAQFNSTNDFEDLRTIAQRWFRVKYPFDGELLDK